MAQAFLNIVGGNAAGGRIDLDNAFVVGREEPGPGALGGDAELSPRHARFYPTDDGRLIVEDLGSVGGTLVNGQRLLGAHQLVAGDRITVGQTVLQFETRAQATGQQTVVSARPVAETTVMSRASIPAAGTYGSAGGYGFEPPSSSGQQSGGGAGRRTLALALAALLFVGVGVGVGFIAFHKSSHAKANSSASPSPTPVATVPAVGVRDASGHPDTTNFTCVPDRNGNPGAGHFRFITSGCEDARSLIAQFPLQRGTSKGKSVYFVVTDSSNKADSVARHVNFSPKLANGVGSGAIQKVTLKNGIIDFPASVNFAAVRTLKAGPGGFPPSAAEPSAVGETGYSPLIELPSGIVINAPQIMNSTGHADKALKLDLQRNTVLYQETEGRYEDKHVHYASFESGDHTAATIEDVTYAPALNRLPKAGLDGLHNSSREELVAFVNGPTGLTNPGRQGENSTILDDADPHNILKEVPVLPLHDSVGDPAYTPGWDVHFAEWTKVAVAGGVRVEVQSTDEVDMWVKMGAVTGPGGAKFGPSNFVVNCPLISIDIP
ncbi:MAG TPA: FHA domain-containing protein [Frankiaceae bacterium]|nr:FHA domain-containing protein [Frankiaceae bacterium]